MLYAVHICDMQWPNCGMIQTQRNIWVMRSLICIHSTQVWKVHKMHLCNWYTLFRYNSHAIWVCNTVACKRSNVWASQMLLQFTNMYASPVNTAFNNFEMQKCMTVQNCRVYFMMTSHTRKTDFCAFDTNISMLKFFLSIYSETIVPERTKYSCSSIAKLFTFHAEIISVYYCTGALSNLGPHLSHTIMLPLTLL